ncbi:MAG: hypothetical protein U9N01_05955 [Euryarchaeota archaeon]|nr:hypothetical protein [Euryarchaeota archaeon]
MNLFLSLNDTVIPYENAQQTYAKAGEPEELKREKGRRGMRRKDKGVF